MAGFVGWQVWVAAFVVAGFVVAGSGVAAFEVAAFEVAAFGGRFFEWQDLAAASEWQDL